MSRHNSTSPLSARRNTSTIRQDNASSSVTAGHHPDLGGLAAISLFAVILVAFVVQSAVTQYVQTTLHFRQPFLLFYIAHSSFTLIYPLHVFYLACTTSHSIGYYTGMAVATLRAHFSLPSSSSPSFPIKRIATVILLLTIGMSLPGLLWYIAVSLASISDVTAIWNTSAFWAYLLSVYLLYPSADASILERIELQQAWWKRLEPRKLLAVAMACVGVGVVVYSGTDETKVSEQSKPRPTEAPSAPLAGDLLTLLASFLYATVQVLYKKYIALPNEPTEADAVASSPLSIYRPLAATDDLDEESVDTTVHNQETDDEVQPADNIHLVETTSHTPPFGLYPNFVTSLVGITTLFIAWPLPLLLSVPATPHNSIATSVAGASSMQIALSIAAIALAGLTWNAGYLILLGIWGPVITSVGNLLTIVLMLIVESIFVPSAPTPSLMGVLGCGMIAGGFAVLVWEVVGPGRTR